MKMRRNIGLIIIVFISLLFFSKFIFADELESPSVSIISPQDSLSIFFPEISFNATFTDDMVLSNSTFFIWNSTSLINTTYFPLFGTSNSSSLIFTLPSYGTYFWNFVVYDNSSNFSYSASNYTLYFSPFQPINVSFEYPTPQNTQNLSSSSFHINLSINTSSEHYSFIDFSNSLVGWYRMDEVNSSGAVIDSSLQSNNALSFGGPTQNYSGRFGSAFQFSNQEYLEVTNVTSLNISCNVTVSAWILPYSGINNGILQKGTQYLSESSTDQGSYSFGLNLNKVLWRLNQAESDATSTSEISDGVWTHVVGTYDCETQKLYVNGVLNTTVSYSTPLISSNESFRIGTYYSTEYSFDGLIDEVLIFNRTLTDSEISSLFSSSSDYHIYSFVGLTNGNYSFRGYSVNSIGQYNQTELMEISVYLPPLNVQSSSTSSSRRHSSSFYLSSNKTISSNYSALDYHSDSNLSFTNLSNSEIFQSPQEKYSNVLSTVNNSSLGITLFRVLLSTLIFTIFLITGILFKSFRVQ